MNTTSRRVEGVAAVTAPEPIPTSDPKELAATSRKATKGQAMACYDNYHGTRRCLNGGTREENERNAPRCREALKPIVEEAARLAANPGKPLAADAWLMRALREDIPNNFAAFNRQYPEKAALPAADYPGLRVIVFDGARELWRGPFAEWAKDNAEGFSPQEVAGFAAALMAKGEVGLDMGAGGAFLLSRVDVKEELWGVLNAIRCRLRFRGSEDSALLAMLPRIDEVLEAGAKA